MSYKKISVIVPTYNQAEYLGACLDSIWFQDWPDIELIVIADPSPDNTSEVLAAFRAAVEQDSVSFASGCDPERGEVFRTEHSRYRHPDFRRTGRELIIVENETRLGHTPSYNLGFEMATGDYCTYIASDDICHPQMLSTLAAPLDADEADFAYSDMFVVDDDMRVLREFRLPEYSFDESFCHWYLLGVSKLYRRELHQRLGYYEPGHTANDHECYLRFAMNGVRFVHVPKVLYSVRSHDQRGHDVHSSESWKKLLAESCELVRRARQHRERHGKK